MKFSEYRALPGMNWSRLKHMRKSPLHFRQAESEGFTDTLAARLGRATHCLVLEPNLFDKSFHVWTETKDRRSKAYQAYFEANRDADILTQSEVATAQAMARSVLQSPDTTPLLSVGLTEHTLTWTDSETGEPCKCRIDKANSRLIELKSSNRVDARSFARTMADMGYHGQLAFYLDGCRANDILVPEPPAIIAVESSPPHDVVVYEVADETIAQGRDEYRQCLRRYRDCMESGEWPGQHTGEMVPLTLPSWYGDDGVDVMITLGGEALDV